MELFLKSDLAKRLYASVKDLPIIDFHNHLAVGENRPFRDITELWLESDPYKHRLMRICGVDEHYITGAANPREKFRTFCTVFSKLAGTPVFDWCRMELYDIFGIEELPSEENADVLFLYSTLVLNSGNTLK